MEMSSPSSPGGGGGDDEWFRRSGGRLPTRYTQDNETLGARLVDMFVGACRRLWSSSYSVISVDVRNAISYQGPQVARFRRGRYVGDSPGVSVSTGGRSVSLENEEYALSSDNWFGRIEVGGARVKLMQIWDLQSQDETKTMLPMGTNIGIGANFDISMGQLKPKLRLRSKGFSLHLLPQPLLEMRGKWPLGTSQVALNVRYRIPLTDLRDFWESPGAHFQMNLFSPIGTGFHFTPGGLEFDEHVVQLGKYTKMRVAASVELPRQLPLRDGEKSLRIEIHRIGIKARTV